MSYSKSWSHETNKMHACISDPSGVPKSTFNENFHHEISIHGIYPYGLFMLDTVSEIIN